MLKITRSLVRQVRTALRRAGIHKDHAASNPPVALSADREGLRILAHSPDAAIEYYQPGVFSAEQMLVPQQFFDDCEGRKNDEIVLELQRDGGVTVECREGKVPQLLRYDPQRMPDGAVFPDKPEHTSSNAPSLLDILMSAAKIAPREASRYSLDCIELSSKGSTVAATDGRQLLIESGFTFPWRGSLLLPGAKLSTLASLPREQPVVVGQAGEWFVLSAGPWTFWLPINSDGRFPNVHDIVRRADTAENQCRISPRDADFLLLALDELPSDESLGYPVTIDLNGHVAVRGKAQGEIHPTELLLPSSQTEGEPRRFSTNRRYLAHALKLGLRELYFFGENTAIQALDGNRAYIWMPLARETSIPPSPNAVRIESRAAEVSAPTTPVTRRRKSVAKTPTPSSEAKPNADKPAAESSTSGTSATTRRRVRRELPTATNLSPIEQAKALRASLRDTLAKTNELVRTLKRQEKQSRVVASTLASLQQLQMSA